VEEIFGLPVVIAAMSANKKKTPTPEEMKQTLEWTQRLYAQLEKRKEDSRKLRTELSAYFPDKEHWSWRDDEDDQAILEFDAMVLATKPEQRQDHLALLDRLMSRDDIVLIIKNLVDLNEKVWNARSIVQNLRRNGYHHHKYFEYKPSTTKDQNTGFPFQFKATHADELDFSYLEQMISQSEERDNKNNNSGKADQSKGFLYMKDLSLQEQLPSLAREFSVKCRIPEILPEGGWCLMRSAVSSSVLIGVDNLTPLSANVLALYLWCGSA